MHSLRPHLFFLFVFTLLTGVCYPAFVTWIGQTFFHHQANGSLIVKKNKIIGSELIGQEFRDPKYFWGRPSMTPEKAYNAELSGASNLGPYQAQLGEQIATRRKAFEHDATNAALSIPIDLLTASASGLDPHISPAAALLQIARVAEQRHIDPTWVQKLVLEHSEDLALGLLGEERVNVLKLNLDLDRLTAASN